MVYTYTINVDMSNILVKIFKYIYSNKLYKLYIMQITIIVYNNLLLSLIYDLLRKQFDMYLVET
jgi:hypothetical protein